MTAYNDRYKDNSVDLCRKNNLPVVYPAEGAKILSKMWEYSKWLQEHDM